MRQSDRTNRHDEERRTGDDNVAGVGELRAVAERLLEAGARALESGRDWLGSRSKRYASGYGERDDDRWRGGSGRHAGPGRDRHDDRDADFDARTPEPGAERDRRLHGIGPYGRESGRSFGPRRQGHVSDDQRGPMEAGRSEFDHLPGSFGYGGEYRRDLSAEPGGSSGPDDHSVERDRNRRDGDDLGRRGRLGHAGRGPKGYTRSDERILDDVNARLSDDSLVDASDIEVRCEQGTITLAGRVDARWIKHRAEDIADSVQGVKEIENRIRVGTVDKRLAREASAAPPPGRTRSSEAEESAPGEDDASERIGRDPPPQQPH